MSSTEKKVLFEGSQDFIDSVETKVLAMGGTIWTKGVQKVGEKQSATCNVHGLSRSKMASLIFQLGTELRCNWAVENVTNITSVGQLRSPTEEDVFEALEDFDVFSPENIRA